MTNPQRRNSPLIFIVPILIVLAAFALLAWLATSLMGNDPDENSSPTITTAADEGNNADGEETDNGNTSGDGSSDATPGVPNFPDELGGLSVHPEYGKDDNYAFYTDDEGRTIKVLPVPDSEIDTIAEDYPINEEIDGWSCRHDSVLFCWIVAEPHSFIFSSQLDDETTMTFAKELLAAQYIG